MGKTRFFSAFLSILLCLTLLGFVFNTAAFAEILENGAVTGTNTESVSRLTEFGKKFLDRIKGEDQKSTSNGTEKINETKVYAGGTPIGLKLYCDGVVVVGMDDVDTGSGCINPAQKAGLQKGDVIKKVNGNSVMRNADVADIIEKSGGSELTFTVDRGGKTKELKFRSVWSKSDGRYKAGLWIRDSSAGIGTLSFFMADGTFASLGHAVCDADTGEIMPLYVGETTAASITGLCKGAEGAAGELCGTLGAQSTGTVWANDATGVYGKLTSPESGTSSLYPVAAPSQVKTGKAQIIATVAEGKTASYEIEISRIVKNAPDRKNLVIRVTDPGLIAESGGIVQGMSGSPIIQNGRLIGVVTHVLVNDPTGGYGIFAATMLEKMQTVKDMEKNA